MERKVFNFELKRLDEDGTFEGYAATFNKIDKGGDKILPGAFRKTLREKKKRPMHWYHDVRVPVGEIMLKEDGNGLAATGALIIEDILKAKELYAFMKKTETVAKQLSIGYDAVKKEFEGDVRILKEIKLYEVSIVTFGMDQEANITNVKAEDEEIPADEFKSIAEFYEETEIFESKPSEDNHICRLSDKEHDKFRSAKRKHDGKSYTIRYGKIKGSTKWEEYEYFYPVSDWLSTEAKAHCKDHEGRFEAAKKAIDRILNEVIKLDDDSCKDCPVYLTPEETDRVAKAIKSLEALLERAEPPEGTPPKDEPPNKGNKPEDHLLQAQKEREKIHKILTEVK
jgi:HK97 family phage prohead protease